VVALLVRFLRTGDLVAGAGWFAKSPSDFEGGLGKGAFCLSLADGKILLRSMSYFADLTPHTYTPTDGIELLNIGWLGEAYPFPQGSTSAKFREALRILCERPILLHRGFHSCEFCPEKIRGVQKSSLGNGQIRILGLNGIWFAAPTMIYHYVIEHSYLPPFEFIESVMNPAAIAFDIRNSSIEIEMDRLISDLNGGKPRT